jgi:hypothetical protein
MTIVNRVCPEMSDIIAVQLECKHCRATISYPPDGWTPVTLKCPNCEVTLVSPSPQSKEFLALSELSGALKTLRNSDGLGFKLRLEFDWYDR